MELLVQHSRSGLVKAQFTRYFSGRRAYSCKNLDYRKHSCLRYKLIYKPDKQIAWLTNRHGIPVPHCSVSALSVRDFCNRSTNGQRNEDENDTNPKLQLGPLLHIWRHQQHRKFSLSSMQFSVADSEKSKVEQTVKALKDSTAEVASSAAGVKKSIFRRIMDELSHYYHGFRLLFIDLRVSAVLCFRLMRGKTLTRREHRLLIRTTSDLFRLLPFSVFIFVPFMELTLPLAIKLFPNMLPSTFQTKDEKMTKMKQQLKVKLEVAKFLQDTLDEMSLQTSGEKSSVAAQQFKDFFVKVRTSGQTPSVEEIIKFTKVLPDELTLDNLPRGQLVALCKLLELHTIGPTSFLTFQLRMALRNIKADDMMIKKEGIENLTVWELQQALKARGMRAVGISDEQMKQQLISWLDLSLKQNIPPTILLLTRAFSSADAMPAPDQIAATISQLPEALGTQAEAKICEMEGKVDNKVRLQLIKEEQKRIAEERAEQERLEAAGTTAQAGMPGADAAAGAKEGISPDDLQQIENALDTVACQKKKLLVEKEELEELKEEMATYKEDIQELRDVKQQLGCGEKELRESKAASRLAKQLNRMIANMDGAIQKAEENKVSLESRVEAGEAKHEELVSITELVSAMRSLQKTPNETRIKKIEEVLARMDIDQDGQLKVDDVVKVLEVLGHEEGNITPQQMKGIVEMLEKEESLEASEKMEKIM